MLSGEMGPIFHDSAGSKILTEVVFVPILGTIWRPSFFKAGSHREQQYFLTAIVDCVSARAV
jgi:hypothetical protein